MGKKISIKRIKKVIDTIHNLRSIDPALTVDMNELDLSGLDLRGMDLSVASLGKANLTNSNLDGANLTGVNLREAILIETSLKNAELTNANLYRANLFGANLYRSILRNANLSFAQITGANIAFADMCDADLKGTQLTVVNMKNTICCRANLLFTVFNGVEIDECDFEEAKFSFTVMAGLDLSTVKGLDNTFHESISYVDPETLRNSKGSIPSSFLLGCGFQKWEIINSKLYSNDLQPTEIRDICNEMLDERLKGQHMRRVFISYSHGDEKFVKKLYKRLQSEGVIVWLDEHELDAGQLQKQVKRALAEQDIVIIVLSQHSIKSDWVENELEMARRKEKDENRDVLCPIAIDGTWKELVINDDYSNHVLWRKLNEKFVIDFTKQNKKSFDISFAKLMRGVKINYDSKPV